MAPSSSEEEELLGGLLREDNGWDGVVTISKTVE
jgi:hypothetical protein